MDDQLLNPFDVDPDEERMHRPEPVPNWSEYCFLYAGDTGTDHGLSIHIGRDCEAPSIFRGSVAIFLPGDEILIAACSGRNGARYCAGAGPLTLTCIEPMRLWLAEFDGLVQRVRRADMMTQVASDQPTEVASFRVLFEAASPLWDLDRAGIAGSMVLVADTVPETHTESNRSHHWQQVGRSRGEIRVRGAGIPISGAAVRDHTYGPRDYATLNGSGWFNGVFPDGMSFMVMATRVGDNFIRGGFIFRNDGSPLEVIKLLEHPPVGDADTPPGSYHADILKEQPWSSFSIVLGTKDGEETIKIEMRHGMPVTLISPAQEFIGTDLSRTADGLQMADCPVRLRRRGMSGVGLLERIARIPHLHAG